MSAIDDSPPYLAPLQELMLRDTFHTPDCGYHVEQVEILFSRPFKAERISAAWVATVEAVEALRTVFDFSGGLPAGLHTTTEFPTMEFLNEVPDSWDSWREADLLRRVLSPGVVPWRVVCWPQARKLVWTFHHALLDGRSIARILQQFLTRLRGGQGITLHRSKWQPPTDASLAIARELFMKWPEVPAGTSGDLRSDGPVHRSLGPDIATQLETRALALKTTAATLVIWAWGQALTAMTGADSVLVEQLRAGAPQPGTAGFTMNVLPLVVHRAGNELLGDSLKSLQADLLALRQIESVSFSDFAPGIYPDLELPGTSTIMIEHATLHHSLQADDLVESVVLSERKADALMATAHVLPDLRLEVDGPGSRRLLDLWADRLCRL